MRVSTVNVHLDSDQVDKFVPTYGTLPGDISEGWISVGPVGFFGTLPQLRQIVVEILETVDEMERETNPFALY